MRVYIGIVRTCSDCGGEARVLVLERPLTVEDKDLLKKGYGRCVSEYYLEHDTSDELPSIGYMNE